MVMSTINPFIEKAETIIETNLQNPNFDIQALANALFIHRVHLFRKMKTLTGLSPTTFIRYYRLEKGKELLLTTNKSISQIAYEVGFKDPAHFTNAFLERYGITPSGARK